MPKKNKTRRLWLNIKILAKPKGLKKGDVIDILLESMNHDYKLPENLEVALLWRNKEEEGMKSDSWQNAMLESAISSPGWDTAVSNYLNRIR